jgi:hypothetical protein
MGLDMYLYRKGKENQDLKEVGYWRKANAIHGWIVTNVQNGVDNCQYYEFPLEKIVELYFLCKKITKNPTEKNFNLLPTTQGFFFGNTIIDDYYLEYIKDTEKILEKILKKPNEKYVYGSSW